MLSKHMMTVYFLTVSFENVKHCATRFVSTNVIYYFYRTGYKLSYFSNKIKFGSTHERWIKFKIKVSYLK